MNDLRVKIKSMNLYTYPDIVITCGEEDFEDSHKDTLQNPKCIIEILSDSTEKYDRGEKFNHYRKIESLEEYILVSQDSHAIESFIKKMKTHGSSVRKKDLIDFLKSEPLIYNIITEYL